ncbi:hypothetical protein BC834DRAFT_237777 [Gloeopeniophorella convolvens]|nr:hypothetical protein BC834DRAFT_237777 [Gloeopeniophorella convolvens]
MPLAWRTRTASRIPAHAHTARCRVRVPGRDRIRRRRCGMGAVAQMRPPHGLPCAVGDRASLPGRRRVVLARLASQSASPVPPPTNKHGRRAPSGPDAVRGRAAPEVRRAPPPPFQTRGKGSVRKGRRRGWNSRARARGVHDHGSRDAAERIQSLLENEYDERSPPDAPPDTPRRPLSTAPSRVIP